jgi:hypothetical protein
LLSLQSLEKIFQAGHTDLFDVENAHEAAESSDSVRDRSSKETAVTRLRLLTISRGAAHRSKRNERHRTTSREQKTDHYHPRGLTLLQILLERIGGVVRYLPRGRRRQSSKTL